MLYIQWLALKINYLTSISSVNLHPMGGPRAFMQVLLLSLAGRNSEFVWQFGLSLKRNTRRAQNLSDSHDDVDSTLLPVLPGAAHPRGHAFPMPEFFQFHSRDSRFDSRTSCYTQLSDVLIACYPPLVSCYSREASSSFASRTRVWASQSPKSRMAVEMHSWAWIALRFSLCRLARSR